MFGPPGHLYVYFTYGMHFCVNVVTRCEGIANAVLLRAVEPTEGLDSMARRRGTDVVRNLARGPARLAQAFALGRDENGLDLMNGPVQIGGRAERVEVVTSPIWGEKPPLAGGYPPEFGPTWIVTVEPAGAFLPPSGD